MSASLASAASLAGIEDMLRAEIGLDHTTVGIALVERAVQRRMDVRNVTSSAAYASLLSDDAAEMQALVEEVVVPETYFYREPDALAAITQRTLAMAELPTAVAPLRVLSVPCSSGEEPYSIAMSLLLGGISPDAIEIDAIDVSREGVRRTEGGVYRGGSFRGEPDAWKRFFAESARGWEIDATVRSIVHAFQGNVVSPAFQPPRAQYDVIFCRNLLIYFDTDAQSQALQKLSALLAPEGALVVGSADSFAVRRAGFEPIPGCERSFLFRRTSCARDVEQIAAPVARKPRVVRGAPVRQAALPLITRKPRPVIEASAAAAAPTPPAASAITCAEIASLADRGKLEAALELANVAVRAGHATADLFALMGTLHSLTPDLVRAEECYRRALFLEPANEDALLHLSLLLDTRGEMTLGARLRARARRALHSDAAVTR